TAKVSITMTPESGWHVYAHEEKDSKDVSKPTLIVMTDSAGFRFSKPIASRPPVEKSTELSKSGIVRYYEEPVTWTIDLEIPKDATKGSHLIRGIVGFHTCTDSSCDPPRATWFEGKL